MKLLKKNKLGNEEHEPTSLEIFQKHYLKPSTKMIQVK